MLSFGYFKLSKSHFTGSFLDVLRPFIAAYLCLLFKQTSYILDYFRWSDIWSLVLLTFVSIVY